MEERTKWKAKKVTRTRDTAAVRMRLGERRVSGLTTPKKRRRTWIILHIRKTIFCTLGKR